jgi:hypothetical protein
LGNVEKRTKRHEKWLYSVDVKSEGRKLNLPDQTDTKV